MKITYGIIIGIFAFQSLTAQTIDVTKYKAMPLPRYTPPKDSNYKELKLVEYNMERNKMDSVYIPADTLNKVNIVEPFGSPDWMQKNEFILKEPSGYSFSYLQAADALVGYPNYPITTIVKLYITMQNPTTLATSNITCSGAMINSYFVITAGHCVHNPQDGSQAVACTVVPEYNMGSQPFGQTGTNHWYSFTQWTVNNNWDYDMAIFQLNTPTGNNTGWLGWGYNGDNSFFTNPANTFHSFGYPAQDDNGNQVLEGGERMYYMSGYMDYWESTNTMCHYNIGYHGQSGSGLYYSDGTNRYVYGVLSHGDGINNPVHTCHCRMDAQMYSYFRSVIQPVGVREAGNTGKIGLYPNPCFDKLTVELGKRTENATVTIYNVLGQSVKEANIKDSEKTEFDVSTLAPGYYLMVVISADQKFIGKFTRQL